MFDASTLSRVYFGCYSPKRQTPPPECVGGGSPMSAKELWRMAGRVSGGPLLRSKVFTFELRRALRSSTTKVVERRRGKAFGSARWRMAELPNVWRLGRFVSREKKSI